MQVGAMDGVRCPGRQRFRMHAGVGENGEPLRKLTNWQGSKFVRVCHGACRFIRILQVTAKQHTAACMAARLIHGRGNAIFHLVGRVCGEGMRKILDDVQAVAATDHANPTVL